MDRQSGPQALLTHLNSVPGVYSAYIWKNVAVTLWFGPVTLPSCEAYERDCRKQTAEHPQGMSIVNIMVPGGRSMPGTEERAEIARIMREYVGRAAAIAVIIPGSGFWASALRSMIVALAMLRPRDLKLRIFGTISEVAEWLPPIHSQCTGLALTAADLLGILQEAEQMASVTKAAA